MSDVLKALIHRTCSLTHVRLLVWVNLFVRLSGGGGCHEALWSPVEVLRNHFCCSLKRSASLCRLHLTIKIASQYALLLLVEVQESPSILDCIVNSRIHFTHIHRLIRLLCLFMLGVASVTLYFCHISIELRLKTNRKVFAVPVACWTTFWTRFSCNELCDDFCILSANLFLIYTSFRSR